MESRTSTGWYEPMCNWQNCIADQPVECAMLSLEDIFERLESLLPLQKWIFEIQEARSILWQKSQSCPSQVFFSLGAALISVDL